MDDNVDCFPWQPKGHSRQGWKCRLCKINVHADCKNGVGRCLPKSRLLRRQKSSSELEITSQRMMAANYDSQYLQQQQQDDDMIGDDGQMNSGREEIDQTYIVLKQASEMAASNNSGSNNNRRPPPPLVLSSSQEQPQSNVSSSDQSLSNNSMGAISRSAGVMRITTSSTQLQQQSTLPQPPSVRRANPNSLSVGEPASFLLSSSGIYWLFWLNCFDGGI